MQVIRTIVWGLLVAMLLLFSWFNWSPVEVRIWENLLVETKVPALVFVSFLIGLLPMWLFHRGATWSLNRKIVSLENAARASAATAAAAAATPPPVVTTADSGTLKPEDKPQTTTL